MRAVFLAYAAPGPFEMIPATIALAAGVSFLGTGLLIHAARRVGWVDRAAAGEEFRKPRRRPVALVGGAALVLAGLACGWPGAAFPRGGWAVPLVVAGAAFLLGLADDLSHYGSRPRLNALAVPARLLLHALLGMGAGLARGHAVLTDPLAALAWAGAGLLVGVTVNTWDHADGLAGGLGVLALAAPAPALAAACLGFLPWNFPRGSGGSRPETGAMRADPPVPAAYLGNAGSWLLGAWILLEPAAWPALALPLMDLVRVSFVRLSRRAPPWSGDRRHLAHRLLAGGFRPLAVAGLCASAVLPAALAPVLSPGSYPALGSGIGLSLVFYGLLLRASPRVAADGTREDELPGR